MPRCNGITKHGLQCTYSAKNDTERCGVHKAYDHDVQREELRVLCQRMYFIREMDEMFRISTLRMTAVRNMNKDQLLAFIHESEDLIRPDYEGYDGPFIPRFRTVIYNHSFRAAAERRVPAHLHHQVYLLHNWMDFMYRSLADNIPEFRGLTMRQLYSNEHATTVIAPRIIAMWNGLQEPLRVAIRRAVNNLRILGQPFAINLHPHTSIQAPPPPAIQQFITDNQNVHRKDTVSYIENVFKQLKKISVPESQRTLGEILVHCVGMKPEAQIQMVRMYHAGDSIYEHKRAYPRALDAVWAFITRHDNKKELYARMSQEMNDNIGMCAQGNLSRICNVLCGYIEGFQPPVPQGVLVQNKMAAIAMDSEGNKVGRAKDALRELLVPESEWGPWIEAFDE